MARLLTLTLNPALDLSVSLECLVPGAVNRTRETHLAAAGKGVNVARVLVALGHQVCVSGFLGADNDGPFLRAFEALGVEDAFLRVPGETRINAKLAEADGRVTDINGPGPAIDAAAWQRLLAWLDALAADPERRPAAVVVAGSLPPGVTPEALATLIDRLRGAGLAVWVDTSGEALAAAIAAGPSAAKPNEHELAAWAGMPLDTAAARLAAAQRLHAAGIQEALLSAGAEGVLWVSRRGTWQATPPPVTVASTVGAGDTLLAALLHGVLAGHAPEQALRFATALSADAVRHLGVGDARAVDFPRLQQHTRVRRLDDVDAGGSARMNVILITACPSGMATTFLAAHRLEQAAGRRGWQTRVEMHSALEPVQPADAETIAAAELIVVAADRVPAPQRLAGKRLYRAPIGEALPDPDAFLARAEREATPFAPDDAEQAEAAPAAPGGQRIVAVTACPTGVAHTFMAAEALAEAGKAMGHEMRVETQGSVGAQNALSDDEIRDAEVVVLACDIEVDPSRFAGKRIYRTSTGSALKQPRRTLEAALAEAAVEDHATAAQGGGERQKSVKERGVYKHLLTGVSFMLPMVVAGGLLIALSFVFGIEAFKEEGTLAAALMEIGGGTAFALMVPVLAGYIAYSIADRPGIAPGMIGGMLAANLGAGFIGGILAGFLAGYAAKAVTRYVKLPASVESLKPILIIPLLASLVTGLTMIYVVGEPVAALLSALTTFLENMGSANAVLLGILLGAMMCFDLGGPVNKAAYTFGVGLLASETYAPMAAIMAAGMVPAIGMGIASLVARAKFSEPEREAGKASLVLGCCFISEGAIPFAAKDPLRVIPASMVGGAVTGALSMLVGAKLMAPHGGIFVLLIPNAITPVVGYLAAILAGSLITGLGYAALKRGGQAVAVEATG